MSARSLSDEGFATSYCLKMGPLPPNEIDKTSQQIGVIEGKFS